MPCFRVASIFFYLIISAKDPTDSENLLLTQTGQEDVLHE